MMAGSLAMVRAQMVVSVMPATMRPQQRPVQRPTAPRWWWKPKKRPTGSPMTQ